MLLEYPQIILSEMRKDESLHTDWEQETSELLPDFTDIDEVRKAFVANEIFNRKY
jgi:hypothetical protein